MSRTAKIPLSDPRFTIDPKVLPQNAAIAEAAKIAFKDDIVGRSLFDPFAEPTLYVAERNDVPIDTDPPFTDPFADSAASAGPLAKVPQAQGRPYKYEHRLDRIFWNGVSNVIFIVGEPGCGKSTFVRFYLHGYCPNRHRDLWTDPVDVVDSSRAEDFRKKLTIRINYQLKQTPEEIHTQFFRVARKEIKEAYRARIEAKWMKERPGADPPDHVLDIETAEGCAFYDPKCRWDSTDHIRLRKRYGLSQSPEDEDTYRRQTVRDMPHVEDRQWFGYALAFMEARKDLFPYLVLVFDNLDNSSPMTQDAAMAFALNDLLAEHPSIHLWKLFVPLWPDSWHELKARAGNILKQARYEAFSLPAVDPAEYFHRRFSLADGQAKARHPLSHYAERIIRALNSRGSRDFVRSISNLTGSNLRWRADLLESSLQNIELIVRLEESRTRVATYFLMLNALLEGFYGAHHRERNAVANLFYASSSHSDPAAILVGVQLLDIVAKQRAQFPKLPVIEDLRKLGFSDANIDEAIAYFTQKELLIALPFERGHKTGQINVDRLGWNTHTVRAYGGLLAEAAYIEDMALVTPVSNVTAQRMTITSPYPAEMKRKDGSSHVEYEYPYPAADFPGRYVARKTSAVCFLEYMRDVEVQFIASIEGRGELQRARTVVEAYGLDSASRRIAAHYKRRLLEEQRRETLRPFGGVTLEELDHRLDAIIAKPDLVSLFGEAG